MKFIRVLSLMLVGIILAFTLTSCGGGSSSEITVTLTIKDEATGTAILDAGNVTIKGKDISVVDAIVEGCTYYEIPYETSTDDAGNEFITKIEAYADSKDEATNTSYFWIYTVAGEDASGSTALADGAVVECIFTSYTPD